MMDVLLEGLQMFCGMLVALAVLGMVTLYIIIPLLFGKQ
jgi:hypothetical protein